MRRAKRVEHTIVNHIHGGNNFFTTGQSSMNTTAFQQQNIIRAGDWDYLQSVLRTTGLSSAALEELSGAVKDDGGQIGSKLTGWVEKFAPKVASGGVKVSLAVGQALLIDYLKQYLGLS